MAADLHLVVVEQPEEFEFGDEAGDQLLAPSRCRQSSTDSSPGFMCPPTPIE
jgi:hypothetical protein